MSEKKRKQNENVEKSNSTADVILKMMRGRPKGRRGRPCENLLIGRAVDDEGLTQRFYIKV